jgi:hypothetical protein
MHFVLRVDVGYRCNILRTWVNNPMFSAEFMSGGSI